MVEDIVVIGAGLAGLRAAERLRERGYGGRLTMIGDEPHRPYNRPPLSKQALFGAMQPADLALRLHGARDLDITWILGDAVTALEPTTKTVRTRSGRSHSSPLQRVCRTTSALRPLKGRGSLVPLKHNCRSFKKKATQG